MLPLHEFLRTVEWIPVCGVGAAIALLVLTSRVRPSEAKSLRRLAVDESGASYALGLTLVTPVYTLLIAMIIECSLMMVVKLGTMYAAYAAARSAMVWLPAEPPRPDKVQLAAVQAMTPFASSRHARLVPDAGSRAAQGADNDAYFAAYSRYADARQSARYVSEKLTYAGLATFTRVERPSSDPHAPIIVTVTYEAPLHVLGVGRLFGKRAPWNGARFYTRRIGSTVTLDLEPSVAESGRLGIGYDADHEQP